MTTPPASDAPSRSSPHARPRARSRPPFDPEPHRAELVAIIREIESSPERAPRGLDALLRRYPRSGRGFFSRSELIAGYRHFAAAEGFLDAVGFARRLRMRPVRTQSGVTPVTVLTKPFPCPGECVFCPSDVRMPKSYLSDEPGAQRAAANRFDPYLQTWSRLAAYRQIGHPTDKVELIVLGGTWSFYPEDYQVWFARRCLDALNDFGRGVDARAEIEPSAPDFDALEEWVEGRSARVGDYNRVVTRFLGPRVPATERGEWVDLEAAQRGNEHAACRCVGFVVETRPDRVDTEEVLRLRRLGCTKVQIGIQSADDEVLRLNQRGHDLETTRRAFALLRGAGFKIHAHWMPNLLGSTPERDLADFAKLFADDTLRPDELKIYPCSLVESAELMRHYESGAWRPYTFDELLGVLMTALADTPRWCRLTRVIRDISSEDIVAGNKLTNFRERAERALADEGRRPSEIRSREIRGERFDSATLELRDTAYASPVGRQHFLELVTDEDRIVGFLRLSLPDRAAPIAELEGCAVLREVHVYGNAIALGERSSGDAQHRGLGERLIQAAVRLARAARFPTLAVISAVGTRAYYRRLGFEDGALYQHYALQDDSRESEARATV